MAEGEQALKDGKSVLARQKLSKALLAPTASDAEQVTLREKIAAINADLLFSQKIAPGDPLVEEYVVQSGDSYERIRKRQQLAVDWRLLERINRTPASKIRVGQKLKLVSGPFHVVVDKSDYRLDVFTGSPDDQASWIYIRSFNVGLGENDTTPVGTFKVKIGGKAIEPNWTNPRTGEQFDGKDPKNPIGNRWIGLEGLGNASSFTSYGLHGTIEPESIGHQRSMGCVRLLNSDVEQVYEMMCEDISVVKIQQ
jgi:lipoprotein-anchoring transpeptidase ErfK/SrfK